MKKNILVQIYKVEKASTNEKIANNSDGCRQISIFFHNSYVLVSPFARNFNETAGALFL